MKSNMQGLTGMCAYSYMTIHENKNTISINGDAYAPRYKNISAHITHAHKHTQHIYRERSTRW